MPVETLCELFPEIAALILQAEYAPIAAERAEAIERLKSILNTLAAQLNEAHARLREGFGSRVEVASVRAAVTSLHTELTILEAAESPRLTRVRPILSQSRLTALLPVA